jgi:hypothetical protein
MSTLKLFPISLILAAVVLLSELSCAQDSPKTWSSGLFWEGKAGKDGKRLELMKVDQDEVHLSGTLSLYQVLSPGQKGSPLVIYGHQGFDGLFAPNVSLQVRNGEGEWQTVESSFAEPPTATLTIAPGAELIGVRLVLDAFHPLIGKFRFGRITLQTGESMQFPLSILLGPGFKPDLLHNEEKANK